MMKKRILSIIFTLIICIGIGTFIRNRPESNHNAPNNSSSQVDKGLTIELTDQQIGILAGLEIYPDWVKEQLRNNNLIYGVVKPGDTVPTGVKDYSYLVASDKEASPIIFFDAHDNQSVTIKYADHDGNQLHVKEVTEKGLVQKFYRTREQKEQVNNDVSLLRTE